jgi:predicted nucleotidyltransferase
MDIEQALSITRSFVDLLRNAGYPIRSAYLFGSVVKGTQDSDSDIDIALIVEGVQDTFDLQVEFMKLRRSIDLRIEPHPFNAEDAADPDPFLREVESTGLRVA